MVSLARVLVRPRFWASCALLCALGACAPMKTEYFERTSDGARAVCMESPTAFGLAKNRRFRDCVDQNLRTGYQSVPGPFTDFPGAEPPAFTATATKPAVVKSAARARSKPAATVRTAQTRPTSTARAAPAATWQAPKAQQNPDGVRARIAATEVRLREHSTYLDRHLTGPQRSQIQPLVRDWMEFTLRKGPAGEGVLLESALAAKVRQLELEPKAQSALDAMLRDWQELRELNALLRAVADNPDLETSSGAPPTAEP